VFSAQYVLSELRRRKGRTLLTALGLGVGIGVAVAVAALSAGLDRAQRTVLEPLTGVGTDMSVTRPLDIDSGGDEGGGPRLSESERKLLEEENGDARVGLTDLGEPGSAFTRTTFMARTQLSFPASTVGRIADLDGVRAAAGSLTLSATTLSGKVPARSSQPQVRTFGGPAQGQREGPRNLDVTSVSVTGVDLAQTGLATVGPEQVTEGRYLRVGAPREVVLNVAYAKRQGLKVGERVKLGARRYRVVGLVRSPLGGEASDMYLDLGELQAVSDRKGRVNTVQVRAADADAVAAVERRIGGVLAGASVTTAADLAGRIGGSLTDARDLVGKLGTILTVVALGAAVLIASLLTLASVTKRTRELGTLKAIGWPQARVVRLLTGESLAQGALGGLLGIVLGVGAALLVAAGGPTLKATVAAPEPRGGGGPVLAGPGGGGFGQGAVTAGSTSVPLEAPVDLGLVALAVGLALLGALVAAAAGGLRAARLRPADALRHLD
jgi:ABC-type lipoprotein release transport system permease subunit